MYRRKLEKYMKKKEEMHKNFCISSFLFCDFALLYRLGIFDSTKKRGFIIVYIARKN